MSVRKDVGVVNIRWTSCRAAATTSPSSRDQTIATAVSLSRIARSVCLCLDLPARFEAGPPPSPRDSAASFPSPRSALPLPPCICTVAQAPVPLATHFSLPQLEL
ncbi:hypothetical protein DPSP01_003230 [Paraphaeosphaeria sporulosa]